MGFADGTIFKILQILYIDDGVFFFNSRSDLIKGVNLINKVFKNFGLEMHIGQNGKASKTECIFFPPPGFFKQEVLASTIEPPLLKNVSSGAPTTTDVSPGAPSNVEVSNSITIKKPAKRKKKKKKLYRQSARDLREDFLYDIHAETQRATVDDGYVAFTKHFCYLGSFVSYNLKDDFDISTRIKKANQNMGMLSNIWNSPHIDMHSKYLYFLAIIINQLLWGCENWALKESSLNDLNIFLHQSIRRILGISIHQVFEEKISNEKIRGIFYNIPDINNMIAARQLQFIGKIAREEDSFIPKQLLTAWVNHKRPRGRPLTTNKISIVKSLQLLYPKNIVEHDIVGNPFVLQIFMDKVGSLHFWLQDALDARRWQWMINSKLRTPHLDIPEPSKANPPQPPPPPQSPRNRSTPPPSPPKQNTNYYNPPSPPRENTSNNFNPDGVEHNHHDSFAILGFSLEDGATERQVRRRYMEMARKYHPDKNKPEETGRNHDEATIFFQLLNNAQSHLRDWL
jgi:hypothetical protein